MFPKKGTRRININGEFFLWHFSTKAEKLSLVVQAEDVEGQMLMFYVPFTDNWLRLGLKPEEKERLPENQIEMMTPSFVAEIIQFGLQNGWQHNSRRQPYKLTMEEGNIKCINS